MTLLEALKEVANAIDDESDRGAKKACTLLALGYVMSLALMSGWTVEDLINLRAWPAKEPTER